MKPALVLVPALPRRRKAARGQDLTLAWHVDAIVVALTRAAMAKRVQVVAPFDDAFGSLMAQVAAQYAVPRFAESNLPQSREDSEGSEQAISFFKSGIARRSRGREGAWPDVFRQMGFNTSEVPPLHDFLENRRPLAVIGVGHGPKIDLVLGLAQHRNIPALTLGRFGPQATGRQPAEASFEEDLHERRWTLEFYSPLLHDGRSHREEKHLEPPDFRLCPPYAVYAQLLVAKLLGEGHDPEYPSRSGS